MNIILYVLLGISLCLNAGIIFLVKKSKQSVALSQADKKDIIEGFGNNVGVISQTITNAQKIGNDAIVQSVQTFQQNFSKDQQKLEESLTKGEKALEDRVLELIKQLDTRMLDMSKNQETKLEQLRNNTERQIKSMQEDNNIQLTKMRETVDEKLSKTINERFDQSFKVLSSQLESVYKSLGEMQTVASSVGNLTKVLANVKTTGILGEIQLGAILDQILTTDQYETNYVTGDGKDPVEFAIKLPGQTNGEFIYLPIDSKFPLTIYTDLCNAYESNEIDQVKQKKDRLKNQIKQMAKDIKTKYIYPPRTTNFAIMFLPVEGLYAEVAKMGLIDELQHLFNVTIAGPTTMSALLNSLQMGFKTLAIQKKSGEVWKILGAVRTEFDKFNEIVQKIQSNFEKTSKDFENLVGTRSRLLSSKLKSVDKLELSETKNILGLPQNNNDGNVEE